jgi:hypothetical protein
MQVPLTAYAEDCSFTGELALSADRLSDFLTSTVEFEVANVTFRALDDGHVVEAGSAAILRDDLYVTLASEPRGREDMRIWTRQYPVLARVGPYVVRGYLHAPPTIDPLKMASRRPIVALTSGRITYTEAGSPVEIEAETVLINSARIEALEPATSEEVNARPIQDAEPAPDGALENLSVQVEGSSAAVIHGNVLDALSSFSPTALSAAVMLRSAFRG